MFDACFYSQGENMQRSQPQNLPGWLLDAFECSDYREELESFTDKEVFNDNIHGPIWLSRVEVRVINTPEFQRLRWISQLAFAQYVFNTAEHSRFSHSLGACYVSKLLVDTVNDKMMRVWTKEKMREGSSQTFARLQNLHQCGDLCKNNCIAHNLPAHYQTVTWSERVVISIATLLHDLPHCPFSHDIEGGYPELPRHDNYAKNPAMRFYLFDTKHSTLARVLEHYSPHFLHLAQADPRWHNDARFQIDPASPEAKLLLAELVFELHAFEKQKQDEVGTVKVHPKKWPNGIVPLDPEDWPSDYYASRWQDSKWRQLYRHDIVENTICADLLDYLERDSLNAGMQHIMDFKFLEQIRIDEYEEEEVHNHAADRLKLRVVFDLKDFKRGTHRHDVITELFNFLQQRYFLRERVCYHRVTQAGAAMLKRSAALVFLADQQRVHAQDKKLTLEMLHLDLRCNSDDSLLRYLATNCGQPACASLMECWADTSHNSQGSNSADLGRRLLERRLYRPIVILSGDNLHTHTAPLFRNERDKMKIAKQIYQSVMMEQIQSDSESQPSANELAQRKHDSWEELQRIEQIIQDHLMPNTGRDGVITYCLKPHLGYKKAAVLCRWTDDKVQPLEELAAIVPSVNKLKGAMEENYTALWRLFVFVRPESLVPLTHETTKIEVERRCEEAAYLFLQWADTVGRSRSSEASHPNPSLNSLRLEEVVSGRIENCRDIRFGFNTHTMPQDANQERTSNLPTIMEEPGKLTLVEVEPSPLSWRDISKTQYGDTTVREFARVFKDEGVASDNGECLICFELLTDKNQGSDVEKNAEAARSRKKASERLRDIIRSRRLEKAKQDGMTRNE